jgi:hypothetical protein
MAGRNASERQKDVTIQLTDDERQGRQWSAAAKHGVQGESVFENDARGQAEALCACVSNFDRRVTQLHHFAAKLPTGLPCGHIFELPDSLTPFEMMERSLLRTTSSVMFGSHVNFGNTTGMNTDFFKNQTPTSSRTSFGARMHTSTGGGSGSSGSEWSVAYLWWMFYPTYGDICLLEGTDREIASDIRSAKKPLKHMTCLLSGLKLDLRYGSLTLSEYKAPSCVHATGQRARCQPMA